MPSKAPKAKAATAAGAAPKSFVDAAIERMVASLLSDGAAQLQERAAAGAGVTAFLGRPVKRERPNERFLQATLRSVSAANRRSVEADMWERREVQIAREEALRRQERRSEEPQQQQQQRRGSRQEEEAGRHEPSPGQMRRRPQSPSGQQWADEAAQHSGEDWSDKDLNGWNDVGSAVERRGKMQEKRARRDAHEDCPGRQRHVRQRLQHGDGLEDDYDAGGSHEQQRQSSERGLGWSDSDRMHAHSARRKPLHGGEVGCAQLEQEQCGPQLDEVGGSDVRRGSSRHTLGTAFENGDGRQQSGLGEQAVLHPMPVRHGSSSLPSHSTGSGSTCDASLESSPSVSGSPRHRHNHRDKRPSFASQHSRQPGALDQSVASPTESPHRHLSPICNKSEQSNHSCACDASPLDNVHSRNWSLAEQGRSAGAPHADSPQDEAWVMTDEDRAAFLAQYRVRGRGAVGSRIDEVGPQLPPDEDEERAASGNASAAVAGVARGPAVPAWLSRSAQLQLHSQPHPLLAEAVQGILERLPQPACTGAGCAKMLSPGAATKTRKEKHSKSSKKGKRDKDSKGADGKSSRKRRREKDGKKKMKEKKHITESHDRDRDS